MESKWNNFPDLGEAFEAVRGMLFGPLDAGFLRHKFGEIVRERVEKRELEMNPRGLFGLERDERELRDRKDRDHHNLTLMALLTSERLRQKLADTYKGFDDSRDKGRDIAERLSELDDKLKRWEEAIYANAARHPVTGEPIFAYKDGRVVDADGNAVPAKDVEGMDLSGTTPAEEKDAYDATWAEAKELREGLGHTISDLDTLEAELDDRIRSDPDKAEEIMDEINAKREAVEGRVDDIGERAKELESKLPVETNEARGVAAEATIQPITRLSL